jgi:hypothetical protein
MPMREDQKKHDEEMLIVHKPGAEPDPKKLGGKSGSGGGGSAARLPRAASVDKQELELMKKQLGMTKDPALRRELLAQVQQKFGNDKAIEVVRELRLKPTDDDAKAAAVHAPPGAGGTKKGKS